MTRHASLALGALLVLGTALLLLRAVSEGAAPEIAPPSAAAIAENAERFPMPSPEVLRQRLTPLEWEVTQEDGTERAFDNAYWNEKRDGIYVDVVTGEPLFSSRDKYRSGTGWPSFTRPIGPEHVTTRPDSHLLSGTRTEVRSAVGDSHLGHVFADGPGPTGLRYCINSAALRFVPADRLEAEGYGAWAAQHDSGR